MNDFATCSRALLGMQPRNRQVPPSLGSASTIVTSNPSSAAKNAAAYPPGPPPNTTTGQCMTDTISLFVRKIGYSKSPPPRWLNRKRGRRLSYPFGCDSAADLAARR